MWAEFVVGAHPCYEGCSPGSPVFLKKKNKQNKTKQKPTFPNSIWNQWMKSHPVEMPLQKSNLFYCQCKEYMKVHVKLCVIK